jgi:hypothetical protein
VREKFLVSPDRLRRSLEPALLAFSTTAEVEALEGTVGQPRALAAIEFGMRVQTTGYNLSSSRALPAPAAPAPSRTF